MKRILEINSQSHSFSQSYGTILPTSLSYLILSTRGYLPWRPDAVMGTNECVNKCVSNLQELQAARRISRMVRDFTGQLSLSANKMIPGVMAVKKNRELLSGHPATSASCFELPKKPRRGSRILARLPVTNTAIAHFEGFPCHSGSTNTSTNAVHMEPFSSSVFKFHG